MTPKRPQNSVLAYEMLEIEARVADMGAELENLGLVGTWVPGIQAQAKGLVREMTAFRRAIQDVIIDGFGITEDEMFRMMKEIEDTGRMEEEE